MCNMYEGAKAEKHQVSVQMLQRGQAKDRTHQNWSFLNRKVRLVANVDSWLQKFHHFFFFFKLGGGSSEDENETIVNASNIISFVLLFSQ